MPGGPLNLTAGQLNDVVLAVTRVPGVVRGFTIHSVLSNLFAPLGPARMHAISQISGRCLIRLERVSRHMNTPELTTALQHNRFLNHDQPLHRFLEAADVAHLTPAEWAWLLKVITDQEDPVLPADTLARKAALFFRYHCGQRHSDLPVGDDTTVEQTLNNSPDDIRTFRDGTWKDVVKVSVRLSQKGLNHFKRRHFVEHFDFTDIKIQNTFFPPQTDITTDKLFLVAAGCIEQLAHADIHNGFATHNITVTGISYQAGVNWTAVPHGTPAQPVAPFDQFFITSAPPNEVTQIPQAELNVIEHLLSEAGRFA